MSGWQQQITDEYIAPKGVVGIVVAQKFPDPQVIRTVLEDGFERVKDETVWVMREAERKGHAVGYAWQTFKAHGITPFLSSLVPAWKSPGITSTVWRVDSEGVVDRPELGAGKHDLRADWRDIEMRATCERIIVFHDKSSNVTADWLDYRDNHLSVAKIYVVERGKVKVKKYRKGRNLQT